MKEFDEIYKKWKRTLSDEEIAEAMMIPAQLNEEEERQIAEEFAKLRLKRRREMSGKDKILSGLLSMKYQLKNYLKENEFRKDKSLGQVLKLYLKVVNRTQKELAEDIDIHPSRLNRIVNGKERIGKSVAYRLERHSGEIIPAIYWWKLMQREVEQEIISGDKEREIEQKHVKNSVYQG